MSQLYSSLDCKKDIHLIWDSESNFVKIQTIGDYKNDYAGFGKGKKLNYTEIFKNFVDDFNRKNKTKMTIVKSHGFPDDDIIQATIKIDKIIWDKGFSFAIMETFLSFKVNEDIIYVVGKSKPQSYARANKSLLQGIEHGTLQFLNVHCK